MRHPTEHQKIHRTQPMFHAIYDNESSESPYKGSFGGHTFHVQIYREEW